METEYKIPFRYEEGTYKLNELVTEAEEQDCIVIRYDDVTDVITNTYNDISTYGINVNPTTEITIEYRSPYLYRQQGKGSNLEKIIINALNGDKYPVYWGVGNEIYKYRHGDIFEKIQECIVKTADKMVSDLSSIPSPLQPLVLSYYYESGDSSIVLADAFEKTNYSDGSMETYYETDCLLRSVPKERAEIIFHSILMGVYNRLCYEIPAKYTLAENFKLFLPERFD